MKNIEKKLDALLNSLIGIAILLVDIILCIWGGSSIFSEIVIIALAVVGLLTCILSGPTRIGNKNEKAETTEKNEDKT